MKRRQVLLAVIVVLLLGTVAVSQIAIGSFNAATGFSGRHGFTCTSCHNVPDMGPLGDEQIYDPPATVTLTGLPGEWELDTVYRLTVTVTGGPPAAPAPAPQGGFEIEASTGIFQVPDNMADLIHIYADDGRGVTYTVAGTQVREWQVDWWSPRLPLGSNVDVFGPRNELLTTPKPATFWVAAMAANGNHIVAAQTSDGGELGDSVDNLTATMPPTQAAIDAWEATLLASPIITDDRDETGLNVMAFEAFSIQGRHREPDATHLGYSLDGASWESKETSGREWRLDFGNGLTPGEHTLLVRSEADGRTSPPVEISIHVEELDVGDVETPFPAAMVTATLLGAALWRRRA